MRNGTSMVRVTVHRLQTLGRDGGRGTIVQEEVAIGRAQRRLCRRGSAQLQERGREVQPSASLQRYLLTWPRGLARSGTSDSMPVA